MTDALELTVRVQLARNVYHGVDTLVRLRVKCVASATGAQNGWCCDLEIPLQSRLGLALVAAAGSGDWPAGIWRYFARSYDTPNTPLQQWWLVGGSIGVVNLAAKAEAVRVTLAEFSAYDDLDRAGTYEDLRRAKP